MNISSLMSALSAILKPARRGASRSAGKAAARDVDPIERAADAGASRACFVRPERPACAFGRRPRNRRDAHDKPSWLDVAAQRALGRRDTRRDVPIGS